MSDLQVGDRVQWQQKDRGRTGAYYAMQGVIVKIMDGQAIVKIPNEGDRQVYKALRELTKIDAQE